MQKWKLLWLVWCKTFSLHIKEVSLVSISMRKIWSSCKSCTTTCRAEAKQKWKNPLVANPLTFHLQCTFFKFQADTNKLHVGSLLGIFVLEWDQQYSLIPIFISSPQKKFQSHSYKALNPTTSAESTSTHQAAILPTKPHCFM